jgi:hypothetical protein
MADTMRNLHHLLKGKQLYSTLYGMYRGATLHNSSPQRQCCQRENSRQLLHLCPLRNTVSKENESGNPQMMPTKEPRSLQHPPLAVEA